MIGTEISIETPKLVQTWNLEASIEQEKNFWVQMANDFNNSDSKSGSIKEYFNGRFSIIADDLRSHLMRKAIDGYACSMTQVIKNDL